MIYGLIHREKQFTRGVKNLGGTVSLKERNAPVGLGPRAGFLPGLPDGIKAGGGRGAAALTPKTALDVTYERIEDGKAVLSIKRPFAAEWRADADSVMGRPGDILRFIVGGNDGNGLTLRQVVSDGRPAVGGGKAQGRGIAGLFRELRPIPGVEAEKPESVEEVRLKKARALGRIRRELAYAGGRASPDAVRELLASGISLEKISLPMLNAALAEIESVPKEDEAPPGGAAAESLRRAGLPVTPRNLAALESVRARIPDKLEDGQIASIIRSGKPVTVETVYVGQFSNGGAEPAGAVTGYHEDGPFAPGIAPEPDGKVWDDIKNSLGSVFAREGVENNAENTEAARFLIARGLPVSGENIGKYRFLSDIGNKVDIGRVFGLAAEKIRAGAGPLEADLMEAEAGLRADAAGSPNTAALRAEAGDGLRTDASGGRMSAAALRAEYESIARALPRMAAGYAEMLTERGLPVNLANLRDAVSETLYPPETRTDAAGLTAKRQLAEIRLKLTHEAANRLIGKNVRIDILPLQEVLEELRAAEREACGRVLRAAGADDGYANVSAMAELRDKLGGFRPLTCNVFADIIRGGIEFSVNGVHRSVTAARQSVLDSLEAFSTAPDPRFGDSFSLVKGQFSGFLAGIGVEPTDAAVRAAAILSRNGMEIGEASLLEVKAIDARLRAVESSLHPRIAAAMIKDGLNPLDMSVDRILEYIKTFRNEYGNDLNGKIAAAIADMDRKSELGPGQREAVVAVYRALGVIGKNENAALGTALKSGAELTLGNLLEAAKYFQRTGARRTDVDVLIGRDFGERVKTEAPEGNIRRALGERRAGYGALVYGEFAEKAAGDAEALAKMIRGRPDWRSAPLEELAAELPEANRISERAAELALNRLNALAQTPPGVVYWMEQNGVPVTLQNAVAAQSLAANPFFAEEALDGLDEETKEEISEYILDTELSALKSGKEPAEILAGLGRALAGAEDFDAPEARGLRLIQNAVKVGGYIRKKNSFQLPIRLRGGVSGLNMYVLNEEALEKGGAKVYIALRTKRLGTVRAYFTQREDTADVSVGAESAEAARRLRENAGALTRGLAEAGFAAGEIAFGVETGV